MSLRKPKQYFLKKIKNPASDEAGFIFIRVIRVIRKIRVIRVFNNPFRPYQERHHHAYAALLFSVCQQLHIL